MSENQGPNLHEANSGNTEVTQDSDTNESRQDKKNEPLNTSDTQSGKPDNEPPAVPEHTNTDDRAVGDWQSRYSEAARKEIRIDAIYVGCIFILTLLALLFTWQGSIYTAISYKCQSCSPEKFNQYAFFFLGGILGGTMFGLKYLYQVVARGLWNIDRRLWRIFSPFLSGGAALAIGGLLDSGLLGLTIKSSTTSFYFSMGFISGYFADKALGKMQEIADTVFGSPPNSSKK